MNGQAYIRKIAKWGWGVYKKYFSEVGYVTRELNYLYCSWNQRDNIALRRQIASRISLPEAANGVVDALRDQGAAKTNMQDFGLDDELIKILSERAEAFGEKSAAEIRQSRKGYSKTYWSNILIPGEKHYEALTAFACSKGIVAAVAKYLGQIPTLQDIAYYYSPPDMDNTQLSASQGWHLDNEQKTKLKIFLSPYAIGTENGPTTYLPLAQTNPALYKNYPDYFDDEQAIRFGIPIDQKLEMIASPGEFYFADTSRIFHYGCRNQKRPRWLVIITYGPVESHLWPRGWKRFYNKAAPFSGENTRIINQFS